MLSRAKKPEDILGTNQENMTDAEQIINMVNKAVSSVSNRLNSLAHFDGTDSKVLKSDRLVFSGFKNFFFAGGDFGGGSE